MSLGFAYRVDRERSGGVSRLTATRAGMAARPEARAARERADAERRLAELVAARCPPAVR